MLERIGRKGDLFRPVLKKKQALGDALERARELLEDKRARGARA
jgi:topoisomerase IA-like protein